MPRPCPETEWAMAGSGAVPERAHHRDRRPRTDLVGSGVRRSSHGSWQSGAVTNAADPDQGMEAIRERVDPALIPIFQRSFDLGFLGSMPIDDQIDHALGFVAIIEAMRTVPPVSALDLGTGGGMPGLVLVSCWPRTRVVLVDASERRTTFLSEVVEGWSGAGRVEVLRGRAEELGRRDGLRESFECVTSRSFGQPAVTAECGSSFLEVGGKMVISEPPDADPLDRWPEGGLAQVGLVRAASIRPDSRFGYQVLEKIQALDERYPRRVGIPVKRPIF